MKKYFASVFVIILLFAFYDCSKNKKNETCSDGILNQDETQTDCGGVCSMCPSCNDGIQNQGEPGVDCGGPCPITSNCNPAAQNSTLTLGGSGWSSPGCASTNSMTIKGVMGATEVTFSFASAASSGTYQVGVIPGTGVCAVTILNAPNQPNGVIWYGRSGTVNVITGSNGIFVNTNGVYCSQYNFIFPVVFFYGILGCAP